MSLFDRLIKIIVFIPALFKNFFVFLARLIELTLTGETDYKIYRGEVADFKVVTDKFKAKMLREEVEVFLRRKFGIQLKLPVVIELYSGKEFNLKGIMMELSGSVGRYHYENLGKDMAHMIYLKKGLPNKKFASVLAHEMAHAFLREKKLIRTDRYLREGFARWIEYHSLIKMGETEEAEKIKKLKTWEHGKAVKKMFDLEGKLGIQEAMEVIRKLD